MSVFESEHTAQVALGHPHIEEFDEWLATADKDALASAIAQFAGVTVEQSNASKAIETQPAFVPLNLDHLVAAEALSVAKGDTRRGQAEVEITARSSWIPAEQREAQRPRRKREPHFKAWKPPQRHEPVLIPIVPTESTADACIDEDPRLFESQATAAIAAAKSICARCTTVTPCREKAISQGNFEMTQGGMSAAELKDYAKTIA